MVFVFSFSSSSTRLGNPSSALRCKKFSWNRCRTLFAIIYVAHVVYTRNGIELCFEGAFQFLHESMFFSSWTWLFIMTTTYRKVASSRPVYYSTVDILGQRSQYISIKFPPHTPSENLKTCE